MSSGHDALSGALAALIDRGEDRGCLELSEVDELVRRSTWRKGPRRALRAARRARDHLRDDCGRESAPVAPVDDAALAT